MKANIIFDNRTKEAHLFSGWGFSCLIGSTLFDTGEKGPWLLENLTRLHHPLTEIDRVVISHDHWDHWGGLWDLLDSKPGLPVYGCDGFSNDLKRKVTNSRGEFHAVGLFQEIEPNIVTTGEIIGTHSGSSIAEQALIIRSEKGISVVTGCAHPGIIRIVEQVRNNYPSDALYAVLGGFHLMKLEKKEALKTLNELKAFGFKQIGATHCSGGDAYAASSLNLHVGAEIEL